jgi:DNA-binding GntR family transcriptional regulator
MSSLQQEAYDTIRQELLRGRWAPGEKLPEEKLAAELGVNRNPVREALLKLAGEGFLERSVGTGCRVVRADARRLKDLWELRQAVEGMACRLAATLADDAQLARIEHEHELLKHLARLGQEAAIAECDTRFHRLIVEASGNDALLRVWNQHLAQTIAMQNTMVCRPTSDLMPLHQKTIEQHRRLVSALKAHDADAAERCVRGQIARGLEEVLGWLNGTDEKPPVEIQVRRPPLRRRRKTVLSPA